MPVDSGIAFVLIPHLDPTHGSLMVELLARHTSMPVVEAAEGMAIEANRVYIIPPNKNMTISGGVLRLSGPVDRGSWQTSIDIFLRSLADDQADKAICIVLSGTGTHGTLGLTAVKAAGGMAMVQDPKTANYRRHARKRHRHGLGRLCVARRADAGSAHQVCAAWSRQRERVQLPRSTRHRTILTNCWPSCVPARSSIFAAIAKKCWRGGWRGA